MQVHAQVQGPPVVCGKLARLLETLFPAEYAAQARVLGQLREQIVQSAEAVEVGPPSASLKGSGVRVLSQGSGGAHIVAQGLPSQGIRRRASSIQHGA